MDAATSEGATTLYVSGSLHEVVGGMIHGAYQTCGSNHGKAAFKKVHQENGHDMFIYFWDDHHSPELSGWWFSKEVGSDQYWAVARSDTQHPPESGWQVSVDGLLSEDALLVSMPVSGAVANRHGRDQRDASETPWWPSTNGPVRAYNDTVGAASSRECDEAYVEWRRILPADDLTNGPSDTNTFLRLCTKLGLYQNPKDADLEGGKCTLQLWRSKYGGTLTFDANKHGKITITQTNVKKKKAIWWLLEPHTYQCQDRPAKRRRGRIAAPCSVNIPSPAELWQTSVHS